MLERSSHLRARIPGLAGELGESPITVSGRVFDPSALGFPLAMRGGAPFRRDEVTRFLESRKIAIRIFFGGNLRRQLAHCDREYRAAGPQTNTDYVRSKAFRVRVYPMAAQPAGAVE